MAYNRTIMHPRFHVEMTRQALASLCSARALEKIIAANLYQDRLAGQIGHDEYHFDNNALEKSYAYIEEQRAIVTASLQASDARSAWAAFGRLTHTAQDFYSHSNYIDLWLSIQPTGTVPAPADVDPMDENLLQSRALHSARMYFPLELLSFIPFLKPLTMPLLPRDSHAWMNLDSPAQGPKFPFAFQAAVRRTRIEFEKTTAGLSQDRVALFVGGEMGSAIMI